MKDFFRSKRFQLIFLTVGALAGFLYWRFVGCNSGTCPIRSVWYWSTLWGAAVGYLLGDFMVEIMKKVKNKREDLK